MMQFTAASNTVIQTIVDDDKRGRVMSYYMMATWAPALSAAFWQEANPMATSTQWPGSGTWKKRAASSAD